MAQKPQTNPTTPTKPFFVGSWKGSGRVMNAEGEVRAEYEEFLEVRVIKPDMLYSVTQKTWKRGHSPTEAPMHSENGYLKFITLDNPQPGTTTGKKDSGATSATRKIEGNFLHPFSVCEFSVGDLIEYGKENGGPELRLEATGVHGEGSGEDPNGFDAKTGFARGPGAKGTQVGYFKRLYFIDPPKEGEEYMWDVMFGKSTEEILVMAGEDGNADDDLVDPNPYLGLDAMGFGEDGEDEEQQEEERKRREEEEKKNAIASKLKAQAKAIGIERQLEVRTATGQEDVQDFVGRRLGYKMYMQTENDHEEYLHLEGTLTAVA